MSKRTYTAVTFEVEGFKEGRKGANYHQAREKLETELNELARDGWKVIGQSLLAGNKQRLLYTLEKKERYQLH